METVFAQFISLWETMFGTNKQEISDNNEITYRLQNCVSLFNVCPVESSRYHIAIQPQKTISSQMFEDVHQWLCGFIFCILPSVLNHQTQLLSNLDITKDLIPLILDYVWLDSKKIKLRVTKIGNISLICIETFPNTLEYATSVWDDFIVYGPHIRLYAETQKWKPVYQESDLCPPRSIGTPGYKKAIDILRDSAPSKHQMETRIALYHNLILEQLAQSPPKQNLLWYRAKHYQKCAQRNWIVLVRWTSIDKKKYLKYV